MLRKSSSKQDMIPPVLIPEKKMLVSFILSGASKKLTGLGRPRCIAWVRVGLVYLRVIDLARNGINCKIMERNFCITIVRFQAKTAEADQATA